MAPDALAEVLGGHRIPGHPDLIAGLEGAEDAGVLKISSEMALVFTTDFFAPVVDDPFTFGEVAAANALSDVFAMGGRVLAALNLVGFPKDLDTGILGDILSGGASKVGEAGGVVAGGHTVEDHEIKYGLAVTGRVHPGRVVLNHGLKPGDALVLTKPLGTGLITSSIKTRGNDGPEVQEAVRWMCTLNGTGLDHILEARPHAMTDVTGFGFLGHLSEMLARDPLAVTVRFGDIPLITGVERCFHRKCRTRGGPTNRAYVGDRLHLDPGLGEWDQELLLDPQTSGGLLVALPADRAEGLAAALREQGLQRCAVVGHVEAAPSPAIHVRA